MVVAGQGACGGKGIGDDSVGLAGERGHERSIEPSSSSIKAGAKMCLAEEGGRGGGEAIVGLPYSCAG